MGSKLNMTQFSLMQDLIDKLVQDFGFLSSAVIRVNMIAQRVCGLHCKMSKLKNKKSQLSPKEGAIYIDENCSPREYTWLVAHEIGHWLLHETIETLSWESDFSLLRRLRTVLGSTKVYNKKKHTILREKEADQFASMLLIPSAQLQAYTKKYAVVDAITANELAHIFDVSPELMLYRLRELADHKAGKGLELDEGSLEDQQSALGNEQWIEKLRYKQQSLQQPDEKIPTLPTINNKEECCMVQLSLFQANCY